jgi:muramoyltetrapeptide carboxypeptidase
MKVSFVKPKALKIGDTIGVVSPAAPVSEDLMELFKRELNALGYKVKLPDNSGMSYGYLAGPDEDRARAFMNIWLDPEVDVVWCSRGGYGCSRLLPFLDFELLKKNPKIFIGMSDITALHCAMHKISLVSYLGPTLSCLFDPKNLKSVFMHQNCWEILSNSKQVYKYFYPENFEYPFEVIKEGRAQGKLLGGNLSLITSLVGTPWQIETKDKILVLEDIKEPPYRLDRMLNQLDQVGLLENLKGVILGTFKECLAKEPERSLSLIQIFKGFFSKRDYPCIMGFPTGHINDQVMLPLGCEVKLDTFSKSIELQEPVINAN